MRMRLKRVSKNRHQTCGVFINEDDGLPVCVTLERPWIWNETSISCIPAGIYQVVPYSSNKFKDAFQILGVSSRNLILIHPGNKVEDTSGCTLPGTSFNKVNGKQWVMNSGQAFRLYKSLVEGKSHELIVED